MRNLLGQGNITWFLGVVEDRNDPVKLGRVRVRCYGWHTEDKDQIPTKELPWAIPIQSVTSAAISGIGQSPTGLVEGTWVVGFFLDGERAQEPVIFGSMAGAPSNLADVQKGFNDPNGVYPKYIDESDVNKRARGEKNITKTEDATISEPTDPYNATYPKNHIYESESGHIIEVDDSSGAERIHIYHKSGSFIEFHPDGSMVIKSKNTYISTDETANIHANNSKIVIDGTLNMTAVSGDIVVDGISLVNHTHTDTPGLGAGITTPPNK